MNRILRHVPIFLFVSFLSGVLLGCGGNLYRVSPASEARLEAGPAAWPRVLAKFVDRQGRVDFKALSNDSGQLESYVAYIAKYSPQSNPEMFLSADQRLAYYLNSYNALAMYGVLRSGIPSDFDGFFKRLKFFFRTKYLIGGREQSLYELENDVVRKLGDPRVHFALNCMSVGCPRLPQVPFDGRRLNDQLEAAAREFFNQEKYVRVDASNNIVYLSQILQFFTEDFVREGQADSLVGFVNKYRQEQVPENYKVEFIPYDWHVNHQP